MQNALPHNEPPARADSDARAEQEQYESRIAPRYTLLIRAAKLLTDHGEYLVVIRDASESGISLRIFHPLPSTQGLTLELQNGDRHELETVWQDEDRAGFRFCKVADVSRIIVSPRAFAKRPIRLNLKARATVTRQDGRMDNVDIINLSQQGANILSSTYMAIDEGVRLSADGLPDTNAKVRWRGDGSCGLIFDDTYQFGDLARIAMQLQRAE